MHKTVVDSLGNAYICLLVDVAELYQDKFLTLALFRANLLFGGLRLQPFPNKFLVGYLHTSPQKALLSQHKAITFELHGANLIRIGEVLYPSNLDVMSHPIVGEGVGSRIGDEGTKCVWHFLGGRRDC